MYDVNTLTLKGAELLAAATAADKLILDGCDATTTYIDATTAASVSSRPASPLSNTTDVSLIGYTASHVQARASFIAGTNTGGDANTLYLYGHKQSAPSDIYVIYVASSQDSFHLPEVGDVANVYETLFDIIYAANADAVTTAGTSTYCTLAEFNLLKERTVTTHAEGTPTTGETQAIYGQKNFEGTVIFDSFMRCGDYSYYSKDLRVYGNNTPSIGEESKPFNNVYCNGIFANDNIVTTQSVECSSLSCSVDAHITDDVYIGGGLEVTGNIEPGEDRQAQLGTSSYPFKKAFVGDIAISGGSIYQPISGSVNYAGSVEFTHTSAANQTTIYGGDARLLLGTTISNSECYINLTVDGQKGIKIDYGSSLQDYILSVTTARASFSCQLVTFLQDTSVAINGDATINSLSVNALTGNEPFYNPITTTRTVVPGSIIMVWASISGGTLGVLHCGERFQNTGSDDVFFFAQNVGGTISSSGVKIPSGTYATLSDVNATGTATWFFVQCLSLN